MSDFIILNDGTKYKSYEREGNIMFVIHFGDYLVKTNKMSISQFNQLIDMQRSTRVKLGLIAIEKNLLTTDQAEEINQLQMQMDKRFGDIAIEKGYLVAEEVNILLSLQKNSYLQFVQNLISEEIMLLEEIEHSLQDFSKEFNYSDLDIINLKSGDINKIFSVLVEIDNSLLNELAALVVRNVTRFINNHFVIEESYQTKEYKFQALAYQNLIGDNDFFVGFAGDNDHLLTIAKPFANEDFDSINEDAFDAVCEFINCCSGLFASKLSIEDINIDMTPPLHKINGQVTTQGNLYVIPFIIKGERVELIVANNNQIEFN